ncbi:MAG TPA: histidinol-phosphate transaminase [Longimicrobiales bacterium]|nr:histidinol-phosphate transaminase [Longimicrobiales bacterium]
MSSRHVVSRRGFVGAGAAAFGYLGTRGAAGLWAEDDAVAAHALFAQEDPYDAMAKLAFNENPYGPSESVLKAMNYAYKYASRYGYPDSGLVRALAAHHGVATENIMLGAGSGEILEVVGVSLLGDGKKVIGVEPSYGQVYQHATSVRAEAVTVPLLPDYRQDMGALIDAANRHARDVGFVYLCNPNNPTGRIVTKREVQQLLDGIPRDMPVLIDEAYHHFVDDSEYATSIPYVLEGRPVIVARTFSKIYGMAGIRLGYAVAPRALLQRMGPYSTGSISALARYGGMAALQDNAAEARVRETTLQLRRKTTAQLQRLGFDVIPSETNFFMVHLRRPVQPVITEFRSRGVAVGRPFPPMTEHLRVSIGTPAEMDRFMAAFREIMQADGVPAQDAA